MVLQYLLTFCFALLCLKKTIFPKKYVYMNIIPFLWLSLVKIYIRSFFSKIFNHGFSTKINRRGTSIHRTNGLFPLKPPLVSPTSWHSETESEDAREARKEELLTKKRWILLHSIKEYSWIRFRNGWIVFSNIFVCTRL